MNATLLLVVFMAYALSLNAWELKTLSNRIVNSSTNTRVRLRCANWYGGHLQSMVPVGLEKQTPDTIAALIATMGINCIRLTLCARSVVENPVVSAEFLLGSESGVRYLEVIDRTVESLAKHDIMIIPNIHTLEANWVNGGGGTPPQGLWNTAAFPLARWLQSISTVAQRYLDIDHVVAIDIYNEIHDTPNVTITWSEEFRDRPESDWKAAATLAYTEMFNANPKLLIIVSALCLGYDVRGMIGTNVGPVQAFADKKLVYSTHFYPWTAWWSNNNFNWNNITTGCICVIVILPFLTGGVYWWVRHEFDDDEEKDREKSCLKRYADYIYALVFSLFMFLVIWIVILCVWNMVANDIGCSTIAFETIPAIIAVAIICGLCLSGFIAWSIYKYIKHTYQKKRFIYNCLFWLAVFTFVDACLLLYISVFQKSYAMFENEIGRWLIDTTPVPIFVGEFGRGVLFGTDNSYDTEVSNRQWDYMTRYLREKDLDWAVWALNGRKYIFGGWTCEGFGLLNDNADRIVNVSFVENLFGKPIASQFLATEQERCH